MVTHLAGRHDDLEQKVAKMKKEIMMGGGAGKGKKSKKRDWRDR